MGATMPEHPADIRVVIPAYRAEATICDCVHAVRRAAANISHEIVIVDDGGNLDLGGTLAGLPVSIMRTPVGGSAARARNLGARGFTGRFLVFIDADVIAAPDCIHRIIAPLRGGLADAAMGNYSSDTTGLGFGASYKQIYIARVYARRRGYLENDFWTAIGAVTTPAFHSAGGFDSSFTGANGEDAQFGRALSACGFRIMGVPDALGQHQHPLTVAQVFANDWRKGMVAMRDCLRSRQTKLSDNKHATSRDRLAVLLVVALAGSALLALAAGHAALLAVPLLLALYLAARGDLVRCFAAQGAWFTARAVPLMGALDLLRAACAAGAAALYVTQRLIPPHREQGALPRKASLSQADIDTASKP
jgi:cellulose synthase/poly-beta-1,6-N-acetylglucosamine synthase-like glycosyltransferase